MKNYILILLLFSACTSQKTLRIKTYGREYSINVPKGCKIENKRDDGGIKEYRASYPDGKIVFITNDVKNGSISQEKEVKYGNNIYMKILTSDTLTLEWISNNLYWKEIKKDKIVIGYKNVPITEKKIFDVAIDKVKVR